MDIIFFLCIAIFFIYKLKNNLGLRNEDDEKRKKAVEELFRQRNGNNRIIDLNPTFAENININKNSINDNLDLNINLKISDNIKSKLAKINFNENLFLKGAETAIEMINEAFSNKDLNTLQKMLSKDVYQNFKKQIDVFIEQNKFLKSSLISVKEKKIENITSSGNIIKIEVFMKMEQINFVENEDGKVILGDKKRIELVKEKWTFERSIDSKENFWIVSSIDSIR